MADPYLGQIQAFAFNFPPRGWTHCDGQLLPIAQNTALFSLLGTVFGGDGRTTFALPDLRGRSIVHVGTGAGLDTITWGERGGDYETVITIPHMPSHTHALKTNPNPANTANSLNNSFGGALNFVSGNATQNMNTTSISNTGGGQPINIRNPFLGIYVSIALTGIYPSRS